MRFKATVFPEIRLDPAQLRVSEEEILDDLLYPADRHAPARSQGGRGGNR